MRLSKKTNKDRYFKELNTVSELNNKEVKKQTGAGSSLKSVSGSNTTNSSSTSDSSSQTSYSKIFNSL